ncbi:hypothetical protein Bca52824_079914 [Brassica carinata]|uniref:Uncharacterized protein n=1 Tax=Brassica carinata TaxID=52824 RepID=A0A8X7Q0X8_BRACI|nr:hypothetical protein Bca52824_079914 [Brassica carinata]
MGLKRASLVLYILFIFPLHHTFPSVNSLPSSADTNHNTLSLINASKPDVVSFEGKARELAVVIKRGGGRGGGGSRGRSTGGGRSSSRGVGRVVPAHTAGAGTRGSHSSSGSLKLAVGWLGLSVLAGLLLV